MTITRRKTRRKPSHDQLTRIAIKDALFAALAAAKIDRVTAGFYCGAANCQPFYLFETAGRYVRTPADPAVVSLLASCTGKTRSAVTIPDAIARYAGHLFDMTTQGWPDDGDMYETITLDVARRATELEIIPIDDSVPF